MASLDDWILQTTGKALGGETIDLSGGEYAGYVGDVNTQDTARKNQMLTPYGLGLDQQVLASDLPAGWEQNQQYLTGIGPQQRDGTYLQYRVTQGQEDALASKLGYTASTPQSQQDFYTGKYGTEFTDEQVEGALTGRYGEIEAAPDMGEGWKGLYDQYKTWGAEDDAWYEDIQQYQGIGEGMKSKTKAQMAAGGMAAGSQQWDRNLERIDKMRVDLAGEREERREALKGTSVYEALDAEYKKNYRKDEQRVKGNTVTKQRDVLVKEGYMAEGYETSVRRGLNDDGTPRYVSEYVEPKWVDPVYGKEDYQEYELTPTSTGRMLYGTGEDKSGVASFDDFYQQNFGNQDYTVPESDLLGEQTLKEETEDQRRARLSASGRNI